MIGRRSFPLGVWPVFRGELQDSGRVDNFKSASVQWRNTLQHPASKTFQGQVFGGQMWIAPTITENVRVFSQPVSFEENLFQFWGTKVSILR